MPVTSLQTATLAPELPELPEPPEPLKAITAAGATDDHHDNDAHSPGGSTSAADMHNRRTSVSKWARAPRR